jgi:hypothetical protein
MDYKVTHDQPKCVFDLTGALAGVRKGKKIVSTHIKTDLTIKARIIIFFNFLFFKFNVFTISKRTRQCPVRLVDENEHYNM